jgi:transcriptional regulator with XRE-family HTH domain
MLKTLLSKDYAVFLAVLKDARLKAGLSQEDVAEKIGETQSFISKCERGERRIDVLELRIWCDALGINLSSFIANLDKNLLGDKSRNEKS